MQHGFRYWLRSAADYSRRRPLPTRRCSLLARRRDLPMDNVSRRVMRLERTGHLATFVVSDDAHRCHCLPRPRTLGNGPISVTILSPPVATARTGYGSVSGRLYVQPFPSAVAVITHVLNTLSFGPIIDLPSQVPATSESLIPPPCACAVWHTASISQPAGTQSRMR